MAIKEQIKYHVRQARLLMTEGNMHLAKDQMQDAYHCYELAEYHLFGAKHLIVEPNDAVYTSSDK